MPRVDVRALQPLTGVSACLSCFVTLHGLTAFGLFGWAWGPRHGDLGSGGLVRVTCGLSQTPLFATVFHCSLTCSDVPTLTSHGSQCLLTASYTGPP